MLSVIKISFFTSFFITENKKAVVISYHSSVSVSALFATAKQSLIPYGTKPANCSFYAKSTYKEALMQVF